MPNAGAGCRWVHELDNNSMPHVRHLDAAGGFHRARNGDLRQTGTGYEAGVPESGVKATSWSERPGVGMERATGSGRRVPVRGASLPVEAVERGFWAVLASVVPPKRRARRKPEARLPKIARDEVFEQITRRFSPGAEELVVSGAALKREVKRGREVAVSLEAYERAREAIAARNELPTRAGQAAWPPGAQTVAARLGKSSWSAAMENMGLSSRGPGRPRGSGHLAEEDFMTALRDFNRDCEESGRRPTYSAYGEWVRKQKESGFSRPSGSTVRQRYLSWSAACEAAGI